MTGRTKICGKNFQSDKRTFYYSWTSPGSWSCIASLSQAVALLHHIIEVEIYLQIFVASWYKSRKPFTMQYSCSLGSSCFLPVVSEPCRVKVGRCSVDLVDSAGKCIPHIVRCRRPLYSRTGWLQIRIVPLQWRIYSGATNSRRPSSSPVSTDRSRCIRLISRVTR